MLFLSSIRDYEVIGIFEDNTGKRVIKRRICHNVSRREAKSAMKKYIVSSFSNTLNINKPIKIDTKPTK